MIPLDKLLHFLTGYMIADIAEPLGFWSVGIALPEMTKISTNTAGW